MIEEGFADEKVKEGWIKTRLMFEVLGITEEASKQGLEKLIDRLDKDDKRVQVYKKEYGEMRKVDKPMPNVKEAFSLICDVELISKSLGDLLQIVMEYGPSVVEILEPRKLNVPISEAQSMLNYASRIVHQFAASGAGGLVFITPDKKVQK